MIIASKPVLLQFEKFNLTTLFLTISKGVKGSILCTVYTYIVERLFLQFFKIIFE